MKRRELIVFGLIALCLGGLILLAAPTVDRDAWRPGAGPHQGGQVAE